MINERFRNQNDAQAAMCYELSSVFRQLDGMLGAYLTDLGRACQANDARAKLENVRKLKQRIKNINELGYRELGDD